MVLTRTGKSTSHDSTLFADVVPTGRSIKVVKRPAPTNIMQAPSSSSIQTTTFSIFVEAAPTVIETPVEPVKDVCASPSHKKARVLTDNTATHLNTIQVQVSPSKKDVKKVNISNEEKAMNGAPEGDLYDVVLLEDSALNAFEDAASAETEFKKQLSSYANTTVWAEKYEAITIFRRIVIHHPSLLTEANTLKTMLSCILDSIASLRSSNVRNGLLALKKASHVCEQIWCADNANSIFQSLLNKSGNGPKFLCDAAFEAAQCAAQKCPINLLIPSIQSFVNHKNIEVSCKAIMLQCQSVTQLSTEFLQKQHEASSTLLTNILTALCLSLSAKKAQGKEKAKEALRFIKQALGEDKFDSYVDAKLPANQSAEIKREIKSASSSSSSSNIAAKPSISMMVKMKSSTATNPVSTSTTVPTAAPRKPWEKSSFLANKAFTMNPAFSKPTAPQQESIDDCLLPAVDALKQLDELLQ